MYDKTHYNIKKKEREREKNRCVLKSQDLRKLIILMLYEGHSEVKLEAFFTVSAW